MILIISKKADLSTDYVIDWLLFYNVNFVRINIEDNLEIIFENNSIIFKSIDYCFELNEIKAFWYRRGKLNIKYQKNNIMELDAFLHQEILKIEEYIFYRLEQLPNINSFLKSDVNRLIVSEKAKNIGLNVPEEFLQSNLNFKEKNHKKYITKSIVGSAMFKKENTFFVAYSNIIDCNKINCDSFFPSLIQEYIEKELELRVFFIDNEFYTMAIFSQFDEMTKVDFRNYNRKKPNRNVPFKLPKEIELKLARLMNELEINCGSIDMILSQNKEYYFLEINPVGQFGMVSTPCNYNLHKIIAEKLIEKTKIYE